MTTSSETTTMTPPAADEPNPAHPDRVTVAKLQLLHDYLVVRPLAVPSKKGRFHMPETASERERSHSGIVLAVGPGDFNEPGTARVPMSVAVGDLVFFGKFSGTEEAVGGATVLVMRESECRLRVPAGAFAVVQHEDERFDHLVEDWCEICHGIPLEQAARTELAREREQLLVGKRPGIVEQMTNEGSIGTGPDLAERQRVAWEANITVKEVNHMLATHSAIRFREGTTVPEVGPVTAVLEGRRPCAGGDDKMCGSVQGKYQTADGPIWLGVRCGHWEKALVEG